jgi:sugar transferase (PEP-CTERM/EpsH1 system associated)
MNGRPNVLYLVHRVPYPPNRGDRIRSFHILKHLATNANVHLATLADEPVDATGLGALAEHCARVAIERTDRLRWPKAAVRLIQGKSATEGLFECVALRRTLEKWADEITFDAVMVFCSSMFQYAAIPALREVRMVVDLVDVDSQKFTDYADQAPFGKSWMYRLEASRIRSLERDIVHRAQSISLVSEAEAELFGRVCPNEKTIAIPNGVDLNYFQPKPDHRIDNRLVFVGALDYPPNIDAMLWFCRAVWPAVKAALPDASLDIVGRKPSRSVQQLAALPSVNVIGSVPDVRPYMASASVAIAPLRIARGIQNKVLEALAMELPIVVSPGALEGLTAEPGKHLVLADQAEQWTRAIVQMCQDHRMAAELGRAGRQFVESVHNWSSCLRPLDRALQLPSTAASLAGVL